MKVQLITINSCVLTKFTHLTFIYYLTCGEAFNESAPLAQCI